MTDGRTGSEHPRNTGPMRLSPRCGARTRSGLSCQAPAVQGKRRCRMHGGSAGSGAPHGNQNALKAGTHTRDMMEQRRAVSALLQRSRQMLNELDEA
jgi:glucans biosynthesis protein